MTVAVLVSGTLFKEPQRRTGKSGRPYTTCTIKAAAADNASSDFWSVLAFGDTAGTELLRLAVGERVTVQGSLKLEIFEKDGQARISRTVFADSVLALRAPPKERKPRAAAPTSQGQATTTNPPDDLNDDLDDLPF